MNHILREIKLSKLTDTPMSMKASKLDKFWNEFWGGMKIMVNSTKGEIRCWKDGYDYYYFIQREKNDYLWCDPVKIWSFFRYDLGLNCKEARELIYQMVGEALNYEVNTPKPVHIHDMSVVEGIHPTLVL